MNKSKTNELKPCPFCGKSDRVHIRRQGKHAYRVVCSSCGATGPHAKVEEWHPHKFIAQGQAVRGWNDRKDE